MGGPVSQGVWVHDVTHDLLHAEPRPVCHDVLEHRIAVGDALLKDTQDLFRAANYRLTCLGPCSGTSERQVSQGPQATCSD